MTHHNEQEADKRTILYPPEELSKNAYIKSMDEYKEMYDRSIEDGDAFWGEMAETLDWYKKWDNVYSWDEKECKCTWFAGGKLNVSYNCLDRHVKAGKGDKVAIIWEPDEPGDGKTYTYGQLLDEVCKFANVLKKHGVKKGDRVCIYLPMIPELPIAMLACARIGAIHSVVFGGFSVRRPEGPHPGQRLQDAGLLRRRLPQRQDRAPEEERRLRPRGVPRRQERLRGQARRRRRGHGGRPRPLVARGDCRRGHHGRLPAGGDGRRGPAVHPLHQRQHRQAQGRAAHHRRLPAPHRPLTEVDLRHPRRRHLVVHRGHRLGHRATATSSTARWPTASPRSCSRASPPIPSPTGSGRSARSTRSPSSTPPPRSSAR